MPAKAPRSRTIFRTIIVPLIILLAAEILLFTGILSFSGALERLEKNDQDIMGLQVASRRDSLENYMVNTVGDLSSLASVVNATTQELKDAGKIDMQSLGSSTAASEELQVRIVDALVETLRAKQASGAYVLFNTDDLTQEHRVGAYGQKPGVYVCDMDPTGTPSPRNEDLVIVAGATSVVQSSQITTNASWKTNFDLDAYPGTNEYEYLFQTFQAAFETEEPKTASDFAYWGTSPRIGGSAGERNVCHAIPLILEDGTVYGIVGVDLSVDYIRTMLPSQELLNNQGASYVLASLPLEEGGEDAQHVAALPIVVSGQSTILGISNGEQIDLSLLSPGQYTFATKTDSYYADSESLRLYRSNSPVEDRRWVLFGVVPEATLHQFVDHVRTMILFAALLMLTVGVVGSIAVSRSVSNPIKELSQEVARARLDEDNIQIPELSQTGIQEVDQLTGAITSLSSDIVSVKHLEQQRLEYERDYDMLTGLMNRRSFYRETNKAFGTPAQLRHAAICLLDIDNLKDINDAYGHDWGDKYMHAAARCFEDALPPDALIARVSGDEFYIFMSGYSAKAEIEDRINQVRAAIEKSSFTFPDGRKGQFTVSGGVALYPDDADSFPELMHLADFSMYQVKQSGKNKIDFFDLETYRRETTALKATAELEEILSDYGLVSYHFQPIFDARTGKAYAYEALMRVNREVLRSPVDVLTYARQEKRLPEIERLTWIRAFECYHNLLRGGQANEEAYLFLNTFANVTVNEDELCEIALANQDIMEHLVIEVTEADTMDEETTEVKRRLPGFTGFFALDDYGSGYNSEVMLLELKPKYVKVDISIVRGINASVDKQRIVSQITEYAHERDMLIIAEGIETAEELDTILGLGVDLLQGYFLARPSAVPGSMSAEGLQHLLEAINS